MSDPNQSQTPPAVGTPVFYRLRPFGEYVPATVVDTMLANSPSGQSSRVPMPEVEVEGAVHLEIQIDRKRYTAAASTGYRRNVTEGNELGCFVRQKPKDAEEQLKEAQQRTRIAEEERRRMTKKRL